MADEPRKQLMEGLKEDLRGEFQAVIMYRLYASMVQGPYRQELRTFFTNEIPEELGHAQILADKVVALGGQPVVTSAPVRYTDDPQQMLKNSLEDEELTVKRYVERRTQAEECGEYGLAVDLDDLIKDETNHRDELRLMLKRWTQSR
jgi:bacterioferritin